MEVVVFGAGSLGGLVGGLLADAHEVTLVARGDHARAIDRDGLVLEGAVDRTVHPRVRTTGEDLSGTLALVTVKSFDTGMAAGALATGTFEAVCSLQNGLGNEERLRADLACPVVAGTTTYGAMRPRPGTVRCTGRGRVTVGALESGGRGAACRVAAAFRAADVPVTVSREMDRHRWEKLAVNAAVNPITALADVPNGAVLDGETATLARETAREVARTARETGVPLASSTAVETLESVVEATATNSSSMREDVRAGRRTEVDAINGAVVDRADRAGVAVPLNRALTTLLRAREAGHGLR